MKRHTNRADIERRVRQMRWPEPTEDLRMRVLTAAPVAARRITWSDRVWFSRAWRVAAAAAVMGIIALDSLSQTTDMGRFIPSPQARAEAQAIDDIRRELDLPEDLAVSLARRALAWEARRAAGEQQRRLALEAFETGGVGR